MYDCEICGKKTESLYVIDVEGAELAVCAKCSSGKNIIDEMGGGGAPLKRKAAAATVEAQEVVVDGYGEKIRKAREAMGVPIKVLGEMINEKKSTLLRVEEERMQPSMALAAKLEKALGIKLSEKESGEVGKAPKADAPITLEDAAMKRKK